MCGVTHLRFCHSGCPTKVVATTFMAPFSVQCMTVAFDTRSKYLSLCGLFCSKYVAVFCTVYCSLLQGLSQTLIHKFGVAAVRGVARNNNITEFELQPCKDGQQVVDGILAQLTADVRRKFKVGYFGWPSIMLCPVGEWCMVSLLMQSLHVLCQ